MKTNMKPITQENISNFKKNLTTKFSELKEKYKEQKMVSFYHSITELIFTIKNLQISKEDKLLLFGVLEEEFNVIHDEYVLQWNSVKDTEDDYVKLIVWSPAQDCIELKRCFSSWRKDIEHPEIMKKANREILDLLD